MNDLTGQKFGRLVVLRFVGKDKWGQSRWSCVCNCGVEKIVRGNSLKSGATKSCGCLQKEKLIKRLTKHGHSTRTTMSKTYSAWHSIIQRCTNANNMGYQDYGGRGITVCKRWMKFENFLEDMGEPPSAKHSIDRIDNDGNYCKSNCRWATSKQNSRNTRRNRLITYDNKTQCIADWADEFNINYNTLYARIFTYNWTIEKALTTPVRKGRK